MQGILSTRGEERIKNKFVLKFCDRTECFLYICECYFVSPQEPFRGSQKKIPYHRTHRVWSIGTCEWPLISTQICCVDYGLNISYSFYWQWISESTMRLVYRIPVTQLRPRFGKFFTNKHLFMVNTTSQIPRMKWEPGWERRNANALKSTGRARHDRHDHHNPMP